MNHRRAADCHGAIPITQAVWPGRNTTRSREYGHMRHDMQQVILRRGTAVPVGLEEVHYRIVPKTPSMGDVDERTTSEAAWAD